MQAVFKRIALVAPRDACVLITGESGTGKELVARAIHRHSARCDRPFLPVHVAALNPNLVESELFGHVRGAFTGAAEARPGLLALADSGTVFLDELADIPLPVQVKLLRVLEQGEVLPVGSTHPQELNIRILSATHQDLSRAVGAGAFRHDLYFRLNVFQIHLPPLRERTEDIVALAELFLRRFEPRRLPLPDETAFLQSGHRAAVAKATHLQPTQEWEGYLASHRTSVVVPDEAVDPLRRRQHIARTHRLRSCSVARGRSNRRAGKLRDLVLRHLLGAHERLGGPYRGHG
jgi:sigma54-dependent transcription regulator